MKEKRVWPRRACKECRKEFQPYNNAQNYCKNPCQPKAKLSIAESNALWLARTDEDMKRRYKQAKDNFMRGDVRVI